MSNITLKTYPKNPQLEVVSEGWFVESLPAIISNFRYVGFYAFSIEII